MNKWFPKTIRVGITNRPLTQCFSRPFVGKTLEEGTLVFETEDIFAACTPDGIAVTTVRDIAPYFEIPKNSVIWDA